MNPYWGQDAVGFILLFFKRLLSFITGDVPFSALASDEIQVFVLILVSVACALVGSFLVLKKMTMLANSLSHTVLLGIVISYLLVSSWIGGFAITLAVLLPAALITGLLTTVLTQFLTQVMKLQEDASIGLVFTTLFALGIVLVTCFTRNTHIGIEAVMGNVDALHFDDLKLIGCVALVNLAVITLLFKEFKITAFDGALASSLGISTTGFNYLLMVLTAATTIGSFRSVGVLLVLAFLVGPVLTARLLTHRLHHLLLIAIGIGALASLLGVALSRHFLSVYHRPLSTAGLTVSTIVLLYLATLIFTKLKK
jgi:manganese/zinc/iron transport system permease protein